MPKIEKILKKQEDGTKKTIYPATICQAIRDGKTGASLEALLSQFNSIYVQYNGTAFDTRNLIPESMRRAGLVITYMNMDSETITERAVSAVQADNDHWGLDVNWTRIDQFTLSGRITISSEGTWLVDGEDTGIKAVGPKGDTGLTPWLKTIDNKLHFSYDNVTWEPCSENIAAWFRWSGNKIQISRDNKTWTDLSGKFADNVHIKGYVANYASLPSGAVQGDIYGVGPTYAAEDTARTNPIYRYYVRNANSWVDNGQFTSLSAGVVQETGDSETEVMSQKAVSTKLSELDSKTIFYSNYSNLLDVASSVPIDNRRMGLIISFYDGRKNVLAKFIGTDEVVKTQWWNSCERYWRRIPLIGEAKANEDLFTIKSSRITIYGTIEQHTNYNRTDFIRIPSNRVLKGYFDFDSYCSPIAFYDLNKNFISSYKPAYYYYQYFEISDIPTNAEYVIYTQHLGNGDTVGGIYDIDDDMDKSKVVYYTNFDNILSAALSIPINERKSGLIVSIKKQELSILYRYIGSDELVNTFWWNENERYWRKIAQVGDGQANEKLFIKKGTRVTTYGAFEDSEKYNCTEFLPIPKTKVLKGYFDFNKYCSPVAFFDINKQYISSYIPKYYYFQYFEISEIPDNASFVVFTQFLGDGDVVAGLYDMGENLDIFQLNSYKETLLSNIGYMPENPNLPQEYKSFAFLHASDIHGVSERYKNIGKVLQHYPNLKFAILTGDLVDGNFASSFEAYNLAKAETSKPIMFVLGNHDVGDVYDLSLEVNGTNEQCYNKYFAPYIESWGVHYSPNKNYYYYDDEDSKIRMICLYEYDNLYKLNADGTSLTEVRINRSYSQEQINWFVNALATLPADYGVIIAQHQAEDVRQNGTNDFCSPVIPVNWGVDSFFEYVNYRWIFPINRIVDAFINKKAINETINQIGGNVPTLSLVADFTSRDEKQEFICYLGGHQHNDYIGFLAHYPQQMQIQIGCSKYDTSVQDCKREEGTISQDYINLMSIDRNRKTIQIARFGCDTSYLMQDRKSISISYRNL